MVTKNCKNEKFNGTIDIAKFIMAILVVGIHTEPFGFNVWLDRGFGIVTRLCVPFFFVISSYFFFKKNNKPTLYVKRLFLLYFIWSVVYLPFDIEGIKSMSFPQILIKYFWNGNEHALWYLCGSIIGFLIVFLLSKFLDYKKILFVGIVFLIIGCMKSTWAPMLESVFEISVYDIGGSRNGLFYGFPYYALGMYIAKRDSKTTKNLKLNLVGLIVSFALLVIESVFFILVFKTNNTILWFSVLPLTFFLINVLMIVDIPIPHKFSLLLRNLSTIIYVAHGLFLIAFESLEYMLYFFCVVIASIVFGFIIIALCNKFKIFKWLKYTY